MGGAMIDSECIHPTCGCGDGPCRATVEKAPAPEQSRNIGIGGPPRARWGVVHEVAGEDLFMMMDGQVDFWWSQASDMYGGSALLFADRPSADFFIARFMRATHPKARSQEWPNAD